MRRTIKGIWLCIKVAIMTIAICNLVLYAEVIPTKVNTQVNSETSSTTTEQTCKEVYLTSGLYIHEWVVGTLIIASVAAFFIAWSKRGK